MKPIDQTRFLTEGNCFAACVASIFEVSLDEVPELNPDSETDWWLILHNWCSYRGVAPLHLDCDDNTMKEVWRCWVIVSGPSSRGLPHATVWRGGEMVHDPHPSRDGILESVAIDVFVAIFPHQVPPLE